MIKKVKIFSDFAADILEMKQNPLFYRILSALFYAIASMLIVFVNKIILTNYGFPSYLVLGVGQMFGIIIVLLFSVIFHLTTLPMPSLDVVKKIFPLPLFYVMNLVTGLGGTKRLNLPMFTVMRRFSLLFIMVAEYIFLKTKQPFLVQFTILIMVFGAIIAAVDDFTFDLTGYALIMLNNLATAANGVCLKKKLNANDLGKNGLLFYNALLMMPFLIAITFYLEDFNQILSFGGWNDLCFIVLFIIACVCGFILNYSTFLCTQYNTALTTACVGTIKNLFVTYGGMIISGDYFYSVMNFIGINVSVVGGILYSYATFTKTEG